MITTKQRSNLRSLANKLKPSVIVGKDNLSDNILTEIETALFHNELIKVSLLQSATLTARECCDKTCYLLHAEPVACIGRVFVVYKKSDKKDIEHIKF